jgi:Protein of unknown function (DUF3606)
MTANLSGSQHVPSSGMEFLMRISNELAWSEPEDAVDIDLTEEADLRYWTQAFSCDKHELINAVQAVGISVAEISAHLRRRPKSGGCQ